MYIWRFCKKAQKNLEIRTSNLETSKICVKNMRSPGGGEDRECTKTATAFWSTVRLRGKALFDIPNRESHGQTVRVGRSDIINKKSTISERIFGKLDCSIRLLPEISGYFCSMVICTWQKCKHDTGVDLCYLFLGWSQCIYNTYGSWWPKPCEDSRERLSYL